MRQGLKSNEAHMPPTSKKNAALPNQSMPKPSGMTLASIIEDKPAKSEVVKYLRQKLDNILEEMSD